MAIVHIPKSLPVPAHLVPGSFAYNYVRGPTTQLAQLSQAVHFSRELNKAKESSKNNCFLPVMARIVNSDLPLTGSLQEEVGPYGLRWGRFDLLQYYKKSNPRACYI